MGDDTGEIPRFAAAFTGRALRATAVRVMGTAFTALIDIGFTATKGAIGTSTTPGTSAAGVKEIEFNGNEVKGDNGNCGALKLGTGADGSTGPAVTVTFFITCAAAGEGATMHMATTMAKTRLTRPL